jgi:predicted GNAT family acetyltransferase
MAAAKKVDYERIEPGWRAGVKSPSQLAAEYTEATGVQISHTAINKHFKGLGIPRDLTAKVHAKADSMVLQAMVSGKVSSETLVKESQMVEQGAIAVASIRMTHRKDINRFRNLAISLLEELEIETGNLADLADLGAILRQEDDKGTDKLNDIYHKIISSAGRVDSTKKLAETLRILIGLEREAYGMNAIGKENDINELAAKIEEARKRANGS